MIPNYYYSTIQRCERTHVCGERWITRRTLFEVAATGYPEYKKSYGALAIPTWKQCPICKKKHWGSPTGERVEASRPPVEAAIRRV